jgi:hypothetical protein
MGRPPKTRNGETVVIKPYLADVSPLPVHPVLRNPITGAPVRAIGVRRNGAPIWPVAGGSQPLGGPAPGTAQPFQAGVAGGQQPAGQFVPGLGGMPVPVVAPGVMPMAVPQQQGFVPQQPPGQYPMFGQPAGQQQQQPYAPPQYAGQQPGVMPFAWQAPQQPGGLPFGTPMPGQQAGLPGQQAGQQPAGGQPAGGHPGQQQNGQHPQGGGQQAGNNNGADGVWDKPYPQKPLADMSDAEQASYWKYHHRKGEDRLRQMGDYDQVKQQLGQLQQMTQTEWQRAVLEAEARGRGSAMEQAAGQMVAVAFQGAAQHRMTPDQIQAQLGVLDAKRFVHGGNVDIAAIQAYVDTIAPGRGNGMVSLFGQPPGQYGQQLPLQQVALGQPGGVPLQPGQPGYGQQPTFGPLGGQQPQYGQPQYGQPQGYGLPQGYGQPGSGQSYVAGVNQGAGQPPVFNGGQLVPQPGYGQVPVPGVPNGYQGAQVPQPVVQAAGLAGLPGLTGRGGLPGVTDFGQGPAVPGPPVNPAQSGSAMAAARHGRTRSQQLAATRG